MASEQLMCEATVEIKAAAAGPLLVGTRCACPEIYDDQQAMWLEMSVKDTIE